MVLLFLLQEDIPEEENTPAPAARQPRRSRASKTASLAAVTAAEPTTAPAASAGSSRFKSLAQKLVLKELSNLERKHNSADAAAPAASAVESGHLGSSTVAISGLEEVPTDAADDSTAVQVATGSTAVSKASSAVSNVADSVMLGESEINPDLARSPSTWRGESDTSADDVSLSFEEVMGQVRAQGGLEDAVGVSDLELKLLQDNDTADSKIEAGVNSGIAAFTKQAVEMLQQQQAEAEAVLPAVETVEEMSLSALIGVTVTDSIDACPTLMDVAVSVAEGANGAFTADQLMNGTGRGKTAGMSPAAHLVDYDQDYMDHDVLGDHADESAAVLQVVSVTNHDVASLGWMGGNYPQGLDAMTEQQADQLLQSAVAYSADVREFAEQHTDAEDQLDAKFGGLAKEAPQQAAMTEQQADTLTKLAEASVTDKVKEVTEQLKDVTAQLQATSDGAIPKHVVIAKGTALVEEGEEVMRKLQQQEQQLADAAVAAPKDVAPVAALLAVIREWLRSVMQIFEDWQKKLSP